MRHDPAPGRRFRRMPRRRLLTAAAALPAAALLPGCSDDRRRPSGGRITLRFQSPAWQQDSLKANKQLVAEWNRQHPDVRVQYVQGAWPTVHDQLLTSFEGGEAPDVIHDASDDLADFAYGGDLADLTPSCRRASGATSRSGAGRPPPSTAGSTASRSSRSHGC